MDAIKNALSGSSNSGGPIETNINPQETSSGGWGDKLNSALGGGKSSEAKEDHLDKGTLHIYAPHGEFLSGVHSAGLIYPHFQVSMHSSSTF